MTAAMIADGSADGRIDAVELRQQPLDGPVLVLRDLRQRIVQLVDVRLVVFPVVNGQRFGADYGCQPIEGVRERRQFMFHRQAHSR